MAFLKWLQTDFLTQVEESVIVLTSERSRTVDISSRHHTYRIKVQKPNATFQICFWYFVFYFFQYKELFHGNIQNKSNGDCSEHESIPA